MDINAQVKSYLRYGIGAALVAGALFWFLNNRESSLNAPLADVVPASERQEITSDRRTPSVRIGKTEIGVDLATTSAAQQKGLSGRSSLPSNRGMLFIFSRPAVYRFWMPDMCFPIDIIWINDEKIVDADEDASPKFDPLHPVFYTPARPVQYVLEVNAGFMRQNNLRIGDPVIFHQIR